MLRSLQFGRAFAAMAVAAFHLSIAFSDPRVGAAPVLTGFTSHGALGVDFFFVLSGFIILFAHEKDIDRKARVTAYARKRFIRVYPMYWVLTAVTIAGTLSSGGEKLMPASLSDVASTVALIHFSGFAVPIGAAWTLFHEVIFYVGFGLLILDRRWGSFVLGAWLALMLLLFRYSPHGDWSFWNTLSSASNLSFFAGMIAFALAKRLRGAQAIATVVAGFGLLATVYLIEQRLGLLTAIELGYSGAFLLIIAGLVGAERSGLVFRFPLLSLIGDASYTLYLAHESVESALLKVAKRLHLLDVADHRLIYAAILIATLAISVLIYRYVEMPMLAYLRRRTSAPQAPRQAAGTSPL